MLFNSLEFAVFFPIVAALYFLLPYASRTTMLLIASCVFYMAFIPAYILILFITILIDYFAGIYLERVSGKQRKPLLWVSILSTCAVLFVFKYYGFFTNNFVGFAHYLGWNVSPPVWNIILPIGLSFHTFQSLSYVVEVYRGHQKAERNFIVYATYVMFFPQLVAGPIERPQNLLHQFHEQHDFDYDRITSGLKRMAWGFFKKLVIADRLALYVNDVYGSPQLHNGLQLSIATFFFAYQIYCDFSGYSDIAIGSARVLGFRLMENFNIPYQSLSIADFWRRWHISLSTWFRDYVYVPLGGSRVDSFRWCRNVLITFSLSGLWHGANWTYAVWGLLNGIFITFGVLTKPARDKVFAWVGLSANTAPRQLVQLLTTFILTLAAWTVFRANSLSDALYVASHVFQGWDFNAITTEHFYLRQFPVAIGAILVLEVGQILHKRVSLSRIILTIPQGPRWAFYVAAIFGVIFTGVFRQTHFIYFQF